MPIKCSCRLIGNLMFPQPPRECLAGLRGQFVTPVPQYPRPSELVDGIRLFGIGLVQLSVPIHMLAPGQQMSFRGGRMFQKPFEFSVGCLRVDWLARQSTE